MVIHFNTTLDIFVNFAAFLKVFGRLTDSKLSKNNTYGKKRVENINFRTFCAKIPKLLCLSSATQYKFQWPWEYPDHTYTSWDNFSSWYRQYWYWLRSLSMFRFRFRRCTWPLYDPTRRLFRQGTQCKGKSTEASLWVELAVLKEWRPSNGHAECFLTRHLKGISFLCIHKWWVTFVEQFGKYFCCGPLFLFLLDIFHFFVSSCLNQIQVIPEQISLELLFPCKLSALGLFHD